MLHTFAVAQPIATSLQVANGTVLISAVDAEEVTVTIDPTDSSRGADVRSAEQTRVELSDDRLTIVQPKSLSRFSPFGANATSIDVVVRLPRGSRIEARSAYGSIRVDGAIGPSSIRTSYGDVTVDEGEDLDLRTGYGEISVRRARGRTEIVGGKVRVAELDGSGTVKSSLGGTTIGIVTGPVDITSTHGDIEIEHAFAPVVARTAYGKVRIDDAVRGAIEMHSSYGALELAVREGTAAWLDLDTNHGTVRNALQDAGPPEGGDPDDPDAPVDTIEVRGRTSWGDILVRRAVPAP